MPNSPYKKPSNEEIIELIRKNAGLMTPTAKAIGVSRSTLWKWIKDDEQLQEAVMDAKEAMIDFAESQLFQSLKEGNVAAIFFYLKTQAKSRGYIERSEVDMRTDPTITWVEEKTYGTDSIEEAEVIDETDD